MIAAEKRVAVASLLGALGVLAPAIAHAEGPTQAETLFREGRVLLDAKRYDEACPKLAESQRLEPGAGTLLALALCHEGQGKPATASAELKQASELGRQNGRKDLAAAADKRAAALEASVPHLVVHLPQNEGKAYRVRCDGDAIEQEDLGAPLPMDPGEHKIEVSAPGKTPRSYTVRISGAGTTEIVVDKLENVPAPAPEPGERPQGSSTEPPPVEVSGGGASTGNAQRTIGVIIIVAGVVGLGVGAYFGGQGLSQSSEANRACPTADSCPNGNTARDESKQSFRTAVIGLGAGTVAITGGLIVYFLAPSASDRKSATTPPPRTARLLPAFGPAGGGLDLVGTF